MSENDFDAAHPPKIGDRGIRVPPAAGIQPDVRTHPGTPVSSDPIEPDGPFEPVDDAYVGGPAIPPSAGAPLGTENAAEPESDSGKGQEAKEEARELMHEGKDSAKHLGDAAKQEASNVLDEAKAQSANLLEELGTDVRAQAATQQEKIAVNLQQISDEFRGMLDASESSGSASALVEQAARHSGNAAEWLGAREPGDLLDAAKDFARRRPGAFLGIALGAGLLAGRITRNAGDGPAPTKDTSAPKLPEGGEPRPASPLPPTINQTMGSGGAGGTGSDPGVGYYPSAVPGTEQGDIRP